MFNLKSVSLKLGLPILICITFSACDKQPLSPDLKESSKQSSSKISALDCDEFARTLAMSLEDKNVRSFVKNEALKMQDGDYDIVYSMVNTKDVNGKSFESVLASKIKGLAKGVSAIDRMKGMTESTPLLNIFVHNIDKWQEGAYEPLVAVGAIGVKENEVKTLKAYDKMGNIVFLDAQTPPETPVIVVSLNERMSFDKGVFTNKFKNVISHNSAKKSRVSSLRVMYNCTYPFREDDKLESAKGTWFSDLSHYEAWANGGPELRIIYTVFNKSNAAAVNFQNELSTTRACSASEFWSFNYEVFYWQSNTYSNEIYVSFIEVDGGQSQEETSSLSFTNSSGTTAGYTVKTTYGSDDDIIRLNYPIPKLLCPPSFWQSCAEYRPATDFWFYCSNDNKLYN